MKVIGLMSGTSVDGVDAALCEVDAAGHFRILSTHFTAYPENLGAAIHALCEQEAPVKQEIEDVDQQLVQIFTNTVKALLAADGTKPGEIAAIGSHGQTIRHCPDCPQPYSLQIGDPQRLAVATGIPTIGDFRTADILAGGQGAPLAPGFHNAIFRSANVDRAILNIGGIANVTFLPAARTAPVIGFDSGPGNTLMDYWTRKSVGRPYDENGAWAAGGTVVQTFLDLLLNEPYFAVRPPKSTGRELFSASWLETKIAQFASPMPTQDIAATLLALSAQSITNAVTDFLPKVSEIYVCGGGGHNQALMQSLRDRLQACVVEHTSALGVDGDWVEAAAFAWLAAQTLEGKPGNLPSVTGARRATVLGKLFRP